VVPEQIQIMPTYDYRCANGHDFELLQKMSDEPRAACPECGADADRRISATRALNLRGAASSSGEPPHAPADLSGRK